MRAREIPQLTEAAIDLLSHPSQDRPRAVRIPREPLLQQR
jgi:hypothetical protein